MVLFTMYCGVEVIVLNQTNLVFFVFQVFVVDVYVDGLKHTIERRYSEFEEMHRMVISFCTLGVI